MLLIPNTLLSEYVVHLNKIKIPMARFTEYKKWLRYYLDFCDKYPVPDARSDRVRLFCEKLKEKKQSVAQREQAAHVVSIYFDMLHHAVPSSLMGHSGPGKGSALLPRLRVILEPPRQAKKQNQTSSKRRKHIMFRKMLRDILQSPRGGPSTPKPGIRKGQLHRNGTRSLKTWRQR